MWLHARVMEGGPVDLQLASYKVKSGTDSCLCFMYSSILFDLCVDVMYVVPHASVSIEQPLTITSYGFHQHFLLCPLLFRPSLQSLSIAYTRLPSTAPCPKLTAPNRPTGWVHVCLLSLLHGLSAGGTRLSNLLWICGVVTSSTGLHGSTT